MKRAGDLLSAILDGDMLHKAQEHSRLFSTWDNLTAKYGISAAAGHSRVQDIRTGVLLVEADHPGWIQILQTKEQVLLSDLQKSFPELGINGIAFRLSKQTSGGDTESRGFAEQEAVLDTAPTAESAAEQNVTTEASSGYDSIANDELRETLLSLGKSIAERSTEKKQK